MTAERVVAITGSSAGVGRATAIEFARHGYAVGLMARGREGLEGAAREVREAGGTPHLVQCDVADAEQLQAAADEIERELGPIDVWVNNAMVTVYGRFWDLEPEEFRRVVDVTFLGSVWGTKIALERMRARNRGTIVQVGSALGERGIPIQSAYCAAKHAINGFVDSVRTELLDDDSDVHLGIVQLPGMNTPQFQWGRNKMDAHPQPVPPIFQPEVAAEAIYHMAHSNRREMWVGYSTAQTILGNRVSSRVVDTYLAKQGISGQKKEGVDDPTPWDNLFEPVEGDFGAHGPFDDRAKSVSLYSKASQHPGIVAGVAGAAIAGAAALASKVLGEDDEPEA